MKSPLAVWLPVVVYMAAIFAFSSLHGNNLPDFGSSPIDKIAHAAEYLILGFLVARAISRSFSKISLAKIIISAIIITSLYAISDEWHQRYVPGRVCDLFDFIADFFGAIIGILLYKKRG